MNKTETKMETKMETKTTGEHTQDTSNGTAINSADSYCPCYVEDAGVYFTKKEKMEELNLAEVEVLQTLEIMVSGKDKPYYKPENVVILNGVEFLVQENKCAETINSKTQRIRLILKV